MLPQLAHGYPAAGAPLHGQPGFLPPQDQGSNVPVGIPAGIAAGHGPVAFAGNAAPGAPVPHVGSAVQGVAHVGNAVPGVAHAPVGAAVMGGHVVNVLPQAAYGNKPILAGQAAQQGSFVQSSGCHEGPPSFDFPRQWQQPRPMSPATSSFPPGFEPRQNVSMAAGIPSGPHPTPFAQGGTISHGNQNHFQEGHEYNRRRRQQQQQQQQQQGQLEYRCQGRSASQTFHQHQHQSGQQAPAPYQQFQSAPCLAQNQHQQHNLLHQDQHQSRNQHQHQHQRQQQSSGLQNLQHGQSSQQPHQYEQSQCQPSHSHTQFLTQTQPYNSPQSTFHPQLRPQSQPHPNWNQEQPLVQPQQSTFQSGGANGIAIGIPVTPMHSKIDAVTAQTAMHSQQITPTWQQPNHIEKSSLNLQGNVPDNHPAINNLQQDVYQNRAGESYTAGLCKQTKSMSVPISPKPEGMRSTDSPRFEETQTKRHSELGTGHPIHPSESGHRNWSTPRQGPMHVRASAGKSSYGTRRNFLSHSNGQLKSPGNQPGPGNRGKLVDDQRGLQPQKTEFRGKPYSKCLVTRPDAQPSRCEPCDRTFSNGEVLAEHLKSHVKCGEEGCFFEAAGKIVKEHRVVEHGKVAFGSTSRGRKALALRSMEDKDDIKRWREERKRSYPTSGNILRKAEEKRKREAEGDCFDEDEQKRRQRMVDIIAKQKQLGYQVPEIPSHYFRGQYNRQPKRSRGDSDVGPLAAQQEEKSGTNTLKEDKENADHADGRCKIEEDRNVSIDNQDPGPLFHDQENAHDFPRRNGHPKRARHRKDRRKSCQKSPPRPLLWQRSSPSLLSKLLSKDIESENSCIMQCCRFIVNNGFLQGCSLASLKHFKWTAGSLVADSGGPSEANMPDLKAALKSDSKVEAMTPSDSNSSACAEEFYEEPDFQGPTAMITKERIGNGDDPLIKDSMPSEIEDVSEEPSTKKEPVDHRLCRCDETELITGSKVHLQRYQSPIACVTVGDSSTDMQTAAKPKTMNLSIQNLEAGKGASENSGSVVENEDDTLQYSNADVTGADSRCCR